MKACQGTEAEEVVLCGTPGEAYRSTRLGCCADGSAVFRYIDEALQDIPLNANASSSCGNTSTRELRCHALLRTPPIPCPAGSGVGVALLPSVTNNSVQPASLRRPNKPVVPDQCWVVSTGIHGRTSHRVRRASWNLSLASWDTWCRWHFAEKNDEEREGDLIAKVPEQHQPIEV
jgi:hypothetical protein